MGKLYYHILSAYLLVWESDGLWAILQPASADTMECYDSMHNTVITVCKIDVEQYFTSSPPPPTYTHTPTHIPNPTNTHTGFKLFIA